MLYTFILGVQQIKNIYRNILTVFFLLKYKICNFKIFWHKPAFYFNYYGLYAYIIILMIYCKFGIRIVDFVYSIFTSFYIDLVIIFKNEAIKNH